MHARDASRAAAVGNVAKLERDGGAAVAERNSVHAARQRRVLQAEGSRSDTMLGQRNGNGSETCTILFAENLRDTFG